MKAFWNLLRRPFVSRATRRRREEELEEELAHHLEMRAAVHRARGLDDAAARREARLEFGSPEVIKEEIRSGWSWAWWETLQRDVRSGTRALLRSPTYTLTVLLTLAVGLGSLGAVFSFLHVIAFRPLPYADEDSLVVARAFRARDPDRSYGVSYLDFRDLAEQSKGAKVAALAGRSTVRVDDGAGNRMASAGIASSTLLEALGLTPARGRFFGSLDDRAGGGRVVVLTHRTWQTRFGAAADVVGKWIQIDEEPAEVIGVAPAALFPLASDPVEFLLPLSFQGDAARPGTANGSRGFRLYEAALLRLGEGVSRAQLATEIAAWNEGLLRAHPEVGKDLQWEILPLRQALFGDVLSRVWMLSGMAGVVLLVAAMNVTNLFLARLLGQARQLALRFVLGATARDLFRQLWTESLLVTLLGGGLGLVVASGLVDLALAYAPESFPRFAGQGVGLVVVVTALAGAGLIALLCAALGTALTLRHDPAGLITNGSRSVTQHGWPERLRRALVMVQVALTLVLLFTAGLLLRSLHRLETSSPGFDSAQVMTAEVNLGAKALQGEMEQPLRMNAALAQLKERLLARPEVARAGFAQCVPLSGTENNTQFDWPGQTAEGGQGLSAQLRFVDGDYFHVLGIPLRAGRTFAETDQPGRPPVAMVNESFARTHLPGQSPLGQRLRLGWGGDAAKEIVGVVGDVRHRSLGDDQRPEVYVPQSQFANSQVTLVLKLRGHLRLPAAELRREILAADPALAISAISTLEQLREHALAVPRFLTLLLGVFAGVALLLTTVGLYGVMSYHVEQRLREFGVRLALGARPGRLVLGVGAAGLRLVLLGLVGGTVGSVIASGWVAPMLFGVGRFDGLTYVSIAVLLLLVGAAGCVVPALRAAGVDPGESLRRD